MDEYLTFQVDKFNFRVAPDRLYSRNGLWVKPEGQHLRVGLSDYLQQRSGDVAFAELKPVGTVVGRQDEFGTIETIKVNIGLPAPAGGKIIEINPMLEEAPEKINLDPYGDGWLVVIIPVDWEADQHSLLTPETYFGNILREAEGEASDQ